MTRHDIKPSTNYLCKVVDGELVGPSSILHFGSPSPPELCTQPHTKVGGKRYPGTIKESFPIVALPRRRYRRPLQSSRGTRSRPGTRGSPRSRRNFWAEGCPSCTSEVRYKAFGHEIRIVLDYHFFFKPRSLFKIYSTTINSMLKRQKIHSKRF